ncbi:hypothetical protein FJZ31_06975 [Candidatus Poribacteria bacterium]|nr:hypothetical protein [Candidatus Poribacteria bacterium]
MTTIWTLGIAQKRTQFSYSGDVGTGVTLSFIGKPYISPEFFKAILGHFAGRTIPGGFNMTDPTPGSLGEWVDKNSQKLNGTKLTPRHASFIAAILVHEEMITSSLKGNAVYLHFDSLPVVDESLSFLQTARLLNLEGPADWSTNLEEYLYGGAKYEE